uniref:Uncharacterized protein n=1 Tax=Capra hircus TaxID=9925 RepID=A0A452DU04_CAPHI
VMRLLDNQLWELGAIAAGLDVQREQAVVIARQQVGTEPVLAGVGVVCTGEREAGARDVHLNLVRGEGGSVVVDVLDLYLDHTDLLVIGEHLEGQLALGVVAAQRLAVNALFSVEEPAVRFHVQQVRPARLASPATTPGLQSSILADVADHRAGALLLRHGVVQVFERQGRSPEEETATDGKVHPRPAGCWQKQPDCRG